MNIKTTSLFDIWEKMIKSGKKIAQQFSKRLENFEKKYPKTAQIIQLSFLYFFALIDLFFSILTAIFGSGNFPETFKTFYPSFQALLHSPLFQIWASPERMFFLSYVILDLMINRSVFNLSKVVRYNILLLFALLMLQGLSISCWDLLFHFQIPEPKAVVETTAGQTGEKILGFSLIAILFVIFCSLYGFLYSVAIKDRLFTNPRIEWLTDSVAFWLKIETPSLKKRRKKWRIN